MPCLVIVWLIWIYLDLFGLLRLVLNCDLIAIIESEDAEGDPQDQAQEPEGFEQGKSPLIMLNPVYENANALLFRQLHSNVLFTQMQLFSAIVIPICLTLCHPTVYPIPW